MTVVLWNITEAIIYIIPDDQFWASLVAQRVKHLPTMWAIRVRSLGQEDPLEKEMATLSSTLAWKIPWTKKPGMAAYSLWGRKDSDTTERLHFDDHLTAMDQQLLDASIPSSFLNWSSVTIILSLFHRLSV